MGDALVNFTIGVGFGTAALGGSTAYVVKQALENGFRKFDTAEASWWYHQKTLGTTLKSFFSPPDDVSKCRSCFDENLQVSTKIPPWQLLRSRGGIDNIRNQARNSRKELLEYCEDVDGKPYPIDVYYIHAPRCWKGWHSDCEGVQQSDTLPLRESWLGMEAVVGIDYSARRIGLSNVWPNELLDIIYFVEERKKKGELMPPPRKPDVVQVHADPIEPNYEILEICQEHGIEFVSYSTLGTQHDMRRGFNPVLGSNTVQRIAKKHSRSTAEVVLSWALQHGMSVIPRSTNPQHIKELSNLLNGPPFLEEEDMDDIDDMKEEEED